MCSVEARRICSTRRRATRRGLRLHPARAERGDRRRWLRVTGRLGVAISGPGATNLLPAPAAPITTGSDHDDHGPGLDLPPQGRTAGAPGRLPGDRRLDLSSVTKYAHQIRTPESIRYHLRRRHPLVTALQRADRPAGRSAARRGRSRRCSLRAPQPAGSTAPGSRRWSRFAAGGWERAAAVGDAAVRIEQLERLNVPVLLTRAGRPVAPIIRCASAFRRTTAAG